MPQELTIKAMLPNRADQSLQELASNFTNRTFIGVDFGTSTTVVSICSVIPETLEFKVSTIDIRQRMQEGTPYLSYKFPSVIAWYHDHLLFGEGAKQIKHKLRYGINLWHSFKMELGTDVGCLYPGSELHENHERYTIINPIDAGQLFFKYLKNQINKYLEQHNLPTQIEYAFSIPASFEANQRRDLMTCLDRNDIRLAKQCFIDEPNAAFISYLTETAETGKTLSIPQESYLNVLVFDFGAGTCDISILEIGHDQKGTYSKNIAISEFKKLGGDDIDKLIAIDVLLPQLLDESGFSKDDFRIRELKSVIIPALLPHAERLKIRMNEDLSVKLDVKSLEALEADNHALKITHGISVDSSKGPLTLSNPQIDFQKFKDIYNTISLIDAKLPQKRMEKEFEFVSIFSPIKSALKKANLVKDEIDYVLFTGGSAKSPIVRKSIMDYFDESEYLVPSDLQAHVSRGAAIHSMILNGFGKNIIKPITSETIFAIIKGEVFDDDLLPLIEAGTIIPSDTMTINDLSPQKDCQKIIEIPICVGSKNKILYIIKIQSQEDTGFLLSDKISLTITINADKILNIKASAQNQSIMVEPLSPFANKELTADERIIKIAEKKYNIALQKNNGEPTYEAMNALYNIYVNRGQHFKAAEILEEIRELFPSKTNLHQIAFQYGQAGKSSKEMEFYDKALANSPSAATAFNVALKYRFTDHSKYQSYLEKAQSISENHMHSKYCLGKLLIEQGEKEKGEKMVHSAYNTWRNMDDEDMSEADISWFISCAEFLGEIEEANRARSLHKEKKKEGLFENDNLTRIKSNIKRLK